MLQVAAEKKGGKIGDNDSDGGSLVSQPVYGEITDHDIPDRTAADCSYESQHQYTKRIESFLHGGKRAGHTEGEGSKNIDDMKEAQLHVIKICRSGRENRSLHYSFIISLTTASISSAFGLLK